MLLDMGLRMESVQFQELLKILGFRRPGLNYSDFIEAFQDLKPTGMGKVSLMKNILVSTYVSFKESVMNATKFRRLTTEELCFFAALEFIF